MRRSYPFAFALILLAACTRQQVDNAGSVLASAAPKIADDGILVARVELRLVQIDPGSALHVAATVNDGVVHLKGKVKSPAIGKRYVAAAKAVPGVRSVLASFTFDSRLPSVRQDVSDFALAAAVRASLIGQGGVNAVPLDVRAHAGSVIVAGTVRTSALRETLLAAAKATHGVRSVVDRLQVRP